MLWTRRATLEEQGVRRRSRDITHAAGQHGQVMSERVGGARKAPHPFDSEATSRDEWSVVPEKRLRRISMVPRNRDDSSRCCADDIGVVGDGQQPCVRCCVWQA